MGLPEPGEESLNQVWGIDGLKDYLPPDEELAGKKKSIFCIV